MHLICGPFSLRYDNGFIRHVRYDGKEILRSIYFALRDENWGTYPLDIQEEKISKLENGFSISYEAVNKTETAELLRWKVLIMGDQKGVITFSLDGEVLENHLKNRAGFCVLHPLQETIDQPVSIFHPDGRVSEEIFPKYIAPGDPFTEIREMRWNIQGNGYRLVFEGDIFETEDQRNWSDASFKTFCTPLRFPFPVELIRGEKIFQKITFIPEQDLPLIPFKEAIEISPSTRKVTLPDIGLGSSPSEEFTEQIFKMIADLKLDHYRIEVDLSNIEWEDSLTNDVLISERLDLPLEVAMQLPSEPREVLQSFINLVQEENVPVRKISLLSKGELTTQQDHISLIPFLKESFPGAVIGAGTDFNFTELNRHRFAKEHSDYVTFSLDPQEHATDDLTMIENLEAQYYGVVSAAKIYNLPIHVSPVLLKRKYNPYATDPAAFIVPEALRTEPRQLTAFCAVWMLGSIKSLSSAGTASVTYFHTIGPHGIVSEEGEPYPVYEALKMLSALEQKSFTEMESNFPLKVEAIMTDDRKLLIWNYTSSPQQVIIAQTGKRITLQPHAFSVIVIA